jgi:PqqD family protein of HPr-rel-A system
VSGWVLADASGTRLHFFDDGCAVFNPQRWETHVVDLLVGTLLEALGNGPCSLQELIDSAVEASDLDAAAAERFVADALVQLTDLRLVAAATDHAHR